MSSDPTFGAYNELRDEVRALLVLMSKVDPSGKPWRNRDWPLQIRGDSDATAELCARLNRLRALTR